MARAAPKNYVSRVRKPVGFDDFWSDVLTQAARVRLVPKMFPEPLRTTEDVEVFQVTYDSLDNVRVAGWYARPRNRSDKLPGLLYLPGYQSDPPLPTPWARLGYAALSVAPRGKLRSNQQFNPGYPGLLTYGIVDRHTYSYRGFYVDAWRGVDFLLSLDEVDPSRIGVTGSSQGGGLTITTSAMRPEVKAAAAGAPYLCGFIDAIELTHTYPYEEINDYLRLHPESRDQVVETLAYFDGNNFAGRINCPIVVNIGLRDNVCPPETGYTLFEAVKSEEKRLYAYDGHGHDAGRAQHQPIVEAFLSKHLNPEPVERE
jgi:cephalosporin-C deacetylase